MGIVPTALTQVDHYALGRAFKRNPQYKSAYTKIIHKQLNTMSVNSRWNIGSPMCPLCGIAIEDWKHVIMCANLDQDGVRKLFLEGFQTLLERHETYPPLMEFLIDYFEISTLMCSLLK